MLIIVEKILSIFLIVGLGFIANKKSIMPKESNDLFIGLLIKVICPCLIFASVTSNTISPDVYKSVVLIFVGGLIFFLLAYVLGFLLCKYLLKIQPAQLLSTYSFAFGSINSGFMGFPITYAIFGKEILFLMIIHNIALNLYLYTFGPLVMDDSSSEKFSIRKTLTSLNNPCTIASFVSIAMLFLGLKLPSFLFESVDMVGNATTPFSMLVIGMQLGQCDFKSIIKDSKLFLASVFKMLLLPILTFLLVNWLPVSVSLKVCLIFAAAFPVAVASSPVVSIVGKDPLPIAKYIALTTLISIATIPLFSGLLISYYHLG